MSVLSIYYGEHSLSGFTIDGVLELQAELTMEGDHTRTASTTQFPVEGGSQVSDHVILGPETISLTGFVTDTPLIYRADAEGASQGAFDALDTLWRERSPVMVSTRFKIYENMIIESITMPETDGDSLEYSIDLTQIRIAVGRQVVLPAITSQVTRDMATRRRDSGRRSTRDEFVIPDEYWEASQEEREEAARTAVNTIPSFWRP